MYMVPSSICSISYEDIEYEQLSFKIHINPVLTNQYLNSDLCLYFFLRQGTIFLHQLIDIHNKWSCDDDRNTVKLSFVWQCQIESIDSIINGLRQSAVDISSIVI